MKYLRYINENKISDYNIGDKIILRGIVDGKTLDNSGILTINSIKSSQSGIDTNMKNGELVPHYKYFGTIYHIKEIGWWITPHNIFDKNIKPIKRPDIDPYGEEDWGYEKEN